LPIREQVATLPHLKWAVLKQKVETSDLITNELIEEINRLDAAKIASEAKAYTYAR
jgi:hypothetical protein